MRGSEVAVSVGGLMTALYSNITGVGTFIGAVTIYKTEYVPAHNGRIYIENEYRHLT